MVALLSLKTHKLLTVVEEVVSSLLCTSTGPVTFAGVDHFMFVFFLFCWGGDKRHGDALLKDGGWRGEGRKKRLDKGKTMLCF